MLHIFKPGLKTGSSSAWKGEGTRGAETGLCGVNLGPCATPKPPQEWNNLTTNAIVSCNARRNGRSPKLWLNIRIGFTECLMKFCNRRL